MHYRDLEITNEAFYDIEPKAKAYDDYLKQKNHREWNETVAISEIRKLFEFIKIWDYHFEGNEANFQRIYIGISKDIHLLKSESIENVTLDNELVENTISRIFDKVANLSSYKYQSTDSSKILHTILTHLFVMWDRKIRKGILGSENKCWGTAYVWEFLPKMQREAQEAISSCMQEKKTSFNEAKEAIEATCGQTLAKLLDQHNYVIFTRTEEFRKYLQKALNLGDITELEQQRLLNKLP